MDYFLEHRVTDVQSVTGPAWPIVAPCDGHIMCVFGSLS